MKLEVRCCCDPHKLMGWIPVPYQEGDLLPHVIRLTLLFNQPKGPGVIELQVERLAYREMVLGRVFKADGIPIETLRRIYGFIEATPKSISMEIRFKRSELHRTNRRAAEIRVHPSILMELGLIPLLESPLKVRSSGYTFDGVPLVEDLKVMSFSVVAA